MSDSGTAALKTAVLSNLWSVKPILEPVEAFPKLQFWENNLKFK
jgi:hypothetical protein